MGAPRVVLVAAAAENGVIGREGGLPWRLSSDLRQFRRLTMGKPVIMGRRTYESIGRPLDGRDNIVVTRQRDLAPAGVLVAHDFDAALTIARDCASRRGADEIAVVGGAQVYAASLPLADRIYMTEVHRRFDGDTVFPPLVAAEWRETSRRRHAAGPRDDADYSLVVLDRVPQRAR